MFSKISNWANQVAFAGQTYKPGKFEQHFFPIMGILLFAVEPALAQTVAGSSAMQSVRATVISYVNVFFIIGLAYGLGRVVWKFFTGGQDAVTALIQLLVGLVVWYFFSTFKDELSGGKAGGVQ